MLLRFFSSISARVTYQAASQQSLSSVLGCVVLELCGDGGVWWGVVVMVVVMMVVLWCVLWCVLCM